MDQSDRPETMVAYASRRIKEALSSGQIAPGARLSPPSLASEYGLSHIPVREALSSLSATGYVDHKRGRGFFARELTTEDLKDIYRLRQVLETEALLQAVPKLTDDDLAEMTELVEQMSRHVGQESRTEYLRLNRRFHFVAYHRSGSQRLVRILNDLWDSAIPYSNLGAVTSVDGNAEHQELVQALADRDTEKALDVMRRHRDLRRENVERWEQSRAAEPK